MTEEKFEKGLNLSQKLDRAFTQKYNLAKSSEGIKGLSTALRSPAYSASPFSPNITNGIPNFIAI